MNKEQRTGNAEPIGGSRFGSAFPVLCSLFFIELLTACGGQEIVLELRHPASFDPTTLQGSLAVGIFEADGPQPAWTTQLRADQLSSRRVLFPELKLRTGQRYEVRLQIGKGAPCSAQGKSPPFVYNDSLDRLAVYFDCADVSSATGATQEIRLSAAAVLLADPGPHGRVVIAGGADLRQADLSLALLSEPNLLASLESYDPATGKFSLMSARLSVARAALDAVPNGRDGAVFTGGLVRGTNKLPTLVGSPVVERLRKDQLTPGPNLQVGRGLHRSLVLGDQLLLAGGFASLTSEFLDSAELWDLSSGQLKTTLKMATRRLTPALAALDDKRAMLVGGNHDALQPLPSDLFCLDGCSGACPGPCMLDEAGFPVGAGRANLTGVQVPCPGQSKGAAYVIGGSRRKPFSTESVIFDDIYCINPDTPSVMMLAGHLITPRALPTAVLVQGPSGPRIFVAGGYNAAPLDTGELIPASCACPAPNSLSKNAAPANRIVEVKLQAGRHLHNAVKLLDGTVLLVGGQVGARSAERFNPAFPAF